MKATLLAGVSALALLIPSLTWASPGLEVEVNGNQLAGDNAANNGSVAGRDGVASDGSTVVQGVDALADHGSTAIDAGRNVAFGGSSYIEMGNGKAAAGSRNAIDSFNVHQVNTSHLSAFNASTDITNIAGASIGGDSTAGNAAASATAFNGALAEGGDSETGQLGAAGGGGGGGGGGNGAQANVAGNSALAADLGIGGGGDETEAEAKSGQYGTAEGSGGAGGAGGSATATTTGDDGGKGTAIAASKQDAEARGGASGPGGNGGAVSASMYSGAINSLTISGTNGMVSAMASTGFNVNQLQSISINAHSSF